jgi:hypothetical protein
VSARLFIIGPQPPIRGGISETNRGLSAHLAENHSVVGISFSRIYPSFFFAKKKKETPPRAEKGAYAIEPILEGLNPFSWERAAKRILSECTPNDLVIFQWWTTYLFPCYYYLTLRLKNKVRMTAVIHNTFPHGVNA